MNGRETATFLHMPIDAQQPWAHLADHWDTLFPLRPERVEMCRKAMLPDHPVLDVGCATGGLVASLLAEGIDANGFDLDPGFVERAKSLLGSRSDRIVEGDLRALDRVHPGRAFGLVVCLGQTFPHLLTDSDVKSFFDASRARLVPGGKLILQVVADRDEQPMRTLPPLEAAGFRLERKRTLTSPDTAEFELKMIWPTGEKTWTVPHRRWTPESLESFATTTGFQTHSIWANESQNQWTGHEPGWIQAFTPA